jgi:hypothetical protein
VVRILGSKHGIWAPSVIYKGTEATALSSKSIRLHLGHLNAVEHVKNLVFYAPISVKLRVLRFF